MSWVGGPTQSFEGAMLVYRSDDLEETEEFLTANYTPMRIESGTDGPSPATIVRSAAESLSIDHLDLRFSMHYDAAPLGKICLCDIESGRVLDHSVGNGPAESFGPGRLFSLAPPDRPYVGTIDRARYSIVMFDPALLDELVVSADGNERVRLLDHHPVSEAAARRLRDAIRHVDRHILTDPEVARVPLVVASALRHVAACVLAAFPHSGVREESAGDRRDSRPATIHRAAAYIDAHADTDIAPADIAAAAHISVRALHIGFRRHLGTTPMGYLRTVRMAHARRDLLAADPAAGDTVSGIASRWGFHHHGRFGATYRRIYGELPVQTLSR